MMRRVLLTGGSGFVAGSVLAQAGEGVEVHVLSRGAALLERDGVCWHSLASLDLDGVRGVVRDVAPDAIVHLAAIADIDYCEAHRDEARRANEVLTGVLAGCASECGAKMVYSSTDNAFDGKRGLYEEGDSPSPVNFYGRTKVAAEKLVEAMGENWVVARVSLVMGLPMLSEGNSFLSRMMPVLAAGGEVGVPTEEIRSPVDVVTLGQALLELAGNDFSGYIHLSGDDVLSRFEMVRCIARQLGYRDEQVVANDPEGIPGRADRPRDVSLANARAHAVLTTSMCGLEEGLERVLAAADPPKM